MCQNAVATDVVRSFVSIGSDAAQGIVRLRLTAVSDPQHGGFTAGSSPVSWGSIDELFVNLTVPERVPGAEALPEAETTCGPSRAAARGTAARPRSLRRRDPVPRAARACQSHAMLPMSSGRAARRFLSSGWAGGRSSRLQWPGGRSFDGSPCPPRIQVHRVRSGGPDAAAVDENQSR